MRTGLGTFSGRWPGRLLAALGLVLIAGGAAADPYRLLVIDEHRLKWGAAELGSGAAITYGFATRAESFPDAVNCRALAPMRDLAPALGAGPAGLDEIAAEAFAMWSVAAELDFRPAAPGEAPDILIGAQGTPERIAFANVWFDLGAARDGVAPLTRATICFNPAIPWDMQASTGRGPGNDFATVLAHEIGHAIGLDHPGARGALMGFQNQGEIDALTAGDAAGAIALYGPRPAK